MELVIFFIIGFIVGALAIIVGFISYCSALSSKEKDIYNKNISSK